VLRAVALYCGSLTGRDPRYREAAETFGRTLAGRGLDLVYGGGSVGLMGIAANAALAAGGVVVGVIPQFLLDREVGHGGVTELVVVSSMHERKSIMAARADAFVALPGGVGTLEELFETWTWTLLGLHAKPCGVLNVAGYFDPLLAFLDRMVAEGFVAPEHRDLLQVDDDPAALLDRLAAAPVVAVKWLDRAPSVTRQG
jgi:uncharacterized protein (TIGR00730 family)